MLHCKQFFNGVCLLKLKAFVMKTSCTTEEKIKKKNHEAILAMRNLTLFKSLVLLENCSKQHTLWFEACQCFLATADAFLMAAQSENARVFEISTHVALN